MYKVLIANVLKPVDETRMRHKLAASLEHVAGAELHLFGKKHSGTKDQHIVLHEYDGNTKHVSRWQVQWAFFLCLMCVKPHLVILETPELVLPYAVYRLMNKSKLVYDVLENYQLNHRWSAVRSGVSKWLMRVASSILHRLTVWMADHIFLAEKIYAKQLHIHTKCSVLENKAPVFFKELDDQPITNGNSVKLLFTGSLSPESGVFQCIEMVSRLFEAGYSVHLTIAGYAMKPIWQKALRKSCADERCFSLYGVERFVDHRAMAQIMQQGNVALMAYADLPHYADKRPTKLFEYLALRKPILAHYKLAKLDLGEYESDIIYADYVHDSADYLYLQIKKLLLHKPEKRPDSALYFDEDTVKAVVGDLLNLPLNLAKSPER
jgi:hypothetical protein